MDARHIYCIKLKPQSRKHLDLGAPDTIRGQGIKGFIGARTVSAIKYTTPHNNIYDANYELNAGQKAFPKL